MRVYFLDAARSTIKMTKRITPSGKEAYPLVKYFTSYEETVETISDLYAVIQNHAKQGHCLIKGSLNRQLHNEDRRNATSTDDVTQYVCFDFDRFETPNLDLVLEDMGLQDVSYVVQYSSSHGLAENAGTVSAHVFMLLDKPVQAPVLKNWLIKLNIDIKSFKEQLSLSRTKTTLRWPLDVTTCQNDKLIYIAPPVFVKPLQDPLKQRIQLVKRKYGRIDATMVSDAPADALKTKERKILNDLRASEDLPPRRASSAWVGNIEVISKPDECVVTGVRESGEFIRLNINGGDSWAYWHPKNNFDLIHDFKTDAWYKTKELVPGYYKDCVSKQQSVTETPTEDDDLILAFRDFKTAHYYNGLWNPETEKLTLYQARNETQLNHWMQSHGRVLGNYIPIWDIVFEPRSAKKRVDVENHRINLFEPTEYMRLARKSHDLNSFPNITQILLHMLGENESK